MDVPLDYVSGFVDGSTYVDDVTIAGLKSVNQAVVSATKATGFSDFNADGIVGMDLSAGAQAQGSGPTFFENLHMAAFANHGESLVGIEQSACFSIRGGDAWSRCLARM